MKTFKTFLKYASILLAILISVIGLFLLSARFKGSVENVTFSSDIELEGVLIKPKTQGPHPVVLLLHGAGGNHQPYDKLYFKYHANAFVQEGFAVLVYSKRGSGKSEDFNYKYFTYQELLNDAQAAIDYIKSRGDLDQKNIGVMGLSESGWFSPELVYNNPEIRFLLNRVSSPFSVTETLEHEIKSDALSEGFTISDVEHTILPISKEIWTYYIDVSQAKLPALGEARDKINDQLSALNQDTYFGRWFTSPKLGDYDPKLYASRAKRYAYDPMPFFKKLQVPMLYVLAGEDKNIPTKKVVSFLNKEKEISNRDITIKLYEKASHYLYKYGLEDGPYEGWMYYDDYLETLTSWSKDQILK